MSQPHGHLSSVFCPTCGVNVPRSQVGQPWCHDHWQKGPSSYKLFDPADGLPWFPCSNCDGPMVTSVDYICADCRGLL